MTYNSSWAPYMGSEAVILNAISKVLRFIAAITLFLPLKGTAAQEKVLL